MSDEKKSFTVKDRRHFTPEGETRVEDDLREATPSGAPGAGPEAGRVAAESEPGVDLAGFLLSLAAQAGLLLGGEKPDLAGGRSLIAILEMLQDKTEGRRTAEEDRILAQILYELRMTYVARAKAAGA